jgi:uncharacterized membrane protein YdfJ with MMPL/SSD domain
VILTLLPALLAICGPRLLGWTERQHLTTSGRGLSHPPGLRARWAGLVHRRPLVAACAAGLLLVVLAAPAVTLKLGGADDGAESTSSTTRRAYDLLSADFFPGLNGPMIVAVELGPAASAVYPDALLAALGRTPGVERAAVNVNNAKAGVAVIRVFPAVGPRSPAATALLSRLREQVIPQALAGSGSRARLARPRGRRPRHAHHEHGDAVPVRGGRRAAGPMMKVVGCGLAAGVVIDAFLLRATLLPALLHLLDRRSVAAVAGERVGTPDRRRPAADLDWTQSLVGGPPTPATAVHDGVERVTVPIRISRTE